MSEPGRQADCPWARLAARRRLWAMSRPFGFPRSSGASPVAFASLRRLAGAALACAAALTASPAFAAAPPQPDSTVDMAKVLRPGPLPELPIGDANGVPVVEYGSLTCPHCAVFSKETLPQLKKEYIDTGKVRFVFREFARNTLDVAGFVLARCLGDDKTFAADELLFAEQDKWAFVDKPLEPLIAAMRPTGMTQEQATECLKNQKLADGVVAITKRAADEIRTDRHADLRHRRQGLWRRADLRPAEGDPRSAGEEVASRLTRRETAVPRARPPRRRRGSRADTRSRRRAANRRGSARRRGARRARPQAAPASAPVHPGCCGAPARIATMSAARIGAAIIGIIVVQYIQFSPTRRVKPLVGRRRPSVRPRPRERAGSAARKARAPARRASRRGARGGRAAGATARRARARRRT